MVGMHSAIKMLNVRVRLILQLIQRMKSGEAGKAVTIMLDGYGANVWNGGGRVDK